MSVFLKNVEDESGNIIKDPLDKEDISELFSIMDDVFYQEEDKIKIINLLGEKYKNDRFVINLLSNDKIFFELLDKALFKLNYFSGSKEKKEHINILKLLNKESLKELREQLFWEYKHNVESLDKNIEETRNRLKAQEKYKQELFTILDGVELTEEEKKLSPHKEIKYIIEKEVSKIGLF